MQPGSRHLVSGDTGIRRPGRPPAPFGALGPFSRSRCGASATGRRGFELSTSGSVAADRSVSRRCWRSCRSTSCRSMSRSSRRCVTDPSLLEPVQTGRAWASPRSGKRGCSPARSAPESHSFAGHGRRRYVSGAEPTRPPRRRRPPGAAAAPYVGGEEPSPRCGRSIVGGARRRRRGRCGDSPPGFDGVELDAAARRPPTTRRRTRRADPGLRGRSRWPRNDRGVPPAQLRPGRP